MSFSCYPSRTACLLHSRCRYSVHLAVINQQQRCGDTHCCSLGRPQLPGTRSQLYLSRPHRSWVRGHGDWHADPTRSPMKRLDNNRVEMSCASCLLGRFVIKEFICKVRKNTLGALNHAWEDFCEEVRSLSLRVIAFCCKGKTKPILSSLFQY